MGDVALAHDIPWFRDLQPQGPLLPEELLYETCPLERTGEATAARRADHGHRNESVMR